MYAESDLEKEVRKIVEGGGYDQLPKAEIVDTILKRKADPAVGDADFYALCAREHTEVAVRRVLQRYRNTSPGSVDPQLVLPGFGRLQRFYLIQRKDEPVIVPVEHLSDAELEGKAQEYVAMGEGCYDHARELRRYSQARAQTD